MFIVTKKYACKNGRKQLFSQVLGYFPTGWRRRQPKDQLCFDNRLAGYHRSMRYVRDKREYYRSTSQEYVGNIKGITSVGALPDGWDVEPLNSAVYNEGKSWKRATKRRHQWKYEKE